MTDDHQDTARTPKPPLAAPIGGAGIIQPSDGTAPDAPLEPMAEDSPTPGNQERVMTDEEKLDTALEDTFPNSDPVQPSRIDGPGN